MIEGIRCRGWLSRRETDGWEDCSIWALVALADRVLLKGTSFDRSLVDSVCSYFVIFQHHRRSPSSRISTSPKQALHPLRGGSWVTQTSPFSRTSSRSTASSSLASHKLYAHAALPPLHFDMRLSSRHPNNLTPPHHTSNHTDSSHPSLPPTDLQVLSPLHRPLRVCLFHVRLARA